MPSKTMAYVLPHASPLPTAPGSPRGFSGCRGLWVVAVLSSLVVPVRPVAAAQQQALSGGPESIPARAGAPVGGTVPVVRTGYAMGTVLSVELAHTGGRAAALAASEGVFGAVEATEALLSTWRPESPLSRLNAAPVGERAVVPHDLATLLEAAFAWIPRTSGAFDPRVGALVDAWDLRGAGRVPTPRELAAALEAAGTTALTLEKGVLVRHHPAAWTDAGGFGKGAALAAAAGALAPHAASGALVDLGGQLLLLGAPDGASEGWPVSVAHPRDRMRPVAELRVRDASVATSGTSERGIQVDGVWYGHLLDPRTGHPAPAWGSVTVVSADPLEADVLATALYVMGPDAGMAYARGLADTGVLFLISSGDALDARWNPAMERWLVATLSTETVEHVQPNEAGNDP